MNKVYKIAMLSAALALSFSASAEVPMLQFPSKAPLSVAGAQHTLDGKPTTVIANTVKPVPAAASRAEGDDDDEIKTYHPEGEYKSLGMATYCEGLFSYYGAPAQLRWQVEIQESVDVPGWYRMAPYAMSNPVTDLIGKTDDTYIYINATEEYYVWCEDFILYDGQYLFTQLVPEMGWTAYNEYGTFDDGVIDMSDAWFCTYNYEQERWEHCEDGFFQIGLPGTYLPEYSLKASSSFHSDNNTFNVIFEKGAGVAAVYVATARGEVRMDYEDASFVVKEGDRIPDDVNFVLIGDLAKNGRGLYSVCLAGTNDKGEIVAAASTLVFVELDDAENWEYFGRGYWQEGILSPHIQGAGLQQINVDIEKHSTIDGYYRLVNPLAEHPLLKDYLLPNDDHNHYIYINATDPTGVYIEPSEVGLQTPNGQSAVWSYVGMRVAEGFDLETLKSYGYCGNLSDDGIITIPDNTLLYAETNYFGGYFVSSGDRFKVDLYRTISGIDTIDADNAADAPVEYFNLQGIRVANPEGGIFIRRQGNKVTKELIH